MNAAGRLLLEAGALLRTAASPAARKSAAREAAAVDCFDLSIGPEDQSNIMLAMRSVIIAIALAAEHKRCHLLAALDALVQAARAVPAQQLPQASAVAEPRRYWLDREA
jgi:hypothetical protein